MTADRAAESDAASPPIRVLIVDDHALVRDGTRQLLELEEGISVVGLAANGLEAIERVRETRPDVVLMDIEMPEMDGIQATTQIAAEFPGCAVLVLSAYDDDQYVHRLVEAGAAGYLLKDVRGGQLIEAIRSVHRGESILHPSIARKVLRSMTAPSGSTNYGAEAPSDRELEVLRLAGKGLGNDAIALALSISVRTVQTHFTNVFGKLNVESRTHAVVEALHRGWIRMEELRD